MNDLPQRPNAFDESLHPLWQLDRRQFTSVGIDIGSATTHFTFSMLEMRRKSDALSSRFVVTDRKILHCSEILRTPFLENKLLDIESLSESLRRAFVEAEISPADLDTGAVITTGDAARKRNAGAVIELLSEQAGKFVCAAAGPILEARLAAYGSGAVARSKQIPGALVLNVDIGGGTTKLTVVRDGQIRGITALNVGARIVTFDEGGFVNKIEPAAADLAADLGIDLRVGRRLPPDDLTTIVATLADAVMAAAGAVPFTAATEKLMILPKLKPAGDADVLMVSGGVSEYLYNHEKRTFGDLGPALGESVGIRIDTCLPKVTLTEPEHGIRATVVGASQFSVQVSGNTIFVGAPDLLPRRNIPVVPIAIGESDLSAERIAGVTGDALTSADVPLDVPIALAVRWPFGPSFDEVERLCIGLIYGLRRERQKEQAAFFVLDEDIAMTVGKRLQNILGHSNFICLDGIELDALDYIDVSAEDPISKVVTVTVKSLVFSG